MSLLSQHRRFAEPPTAFTQQYMQWLGHHEFGATHQAFRLGRGAVSSGDPDTPGYWLTRWVSAHYALCSRSAREWPNVLLVPSDDLWRATLHLWPAIARRIGIEAKRRCRKSARCRSAPRPRT
jgi:hypothetical protein